MKLHCQDNNTKIIEVVDNVINENLEKFMKCDVFTPDRIVKIMSNKLKQSGSLLEPSVGTGNLLKYINQELFERIDVYELKKEYIDEIKYPNIIKYNTDFLRAEIHSKYDNIIMNPPYIKVQDLTIEYRDFIKSKFSILKKGMVDIYYAFILKCIDLLKNDGIMVSITPNSYLYNKSAIGLRKYLIDNKYIQEIIDFKSEKVFKGVSVYCCITIFSKIEKEYLIYNNKKIFYSEIDKNYSIFNSNNISGKTLKNICRISNGIATLRDKIYIHDKKLYNESCWNEITNSKKLKYIIYPYKNGEIIQDDQFKKENPLTYEYLFNNKEELLKRDKGHKKYPTWYAYGRTQSLKKPKNKSIYIPCFIDPEKIEEYIEIKEPILYQGCFCIEPNNVNDIELIKKNIINNIEFIKSSSSKRSGDWINLSSRILYQIPLSN